MTYWTIQHKTVVAQLRRDGVYYPDFTLSPQVHRETYDKLLTIYNSINQTSYKGLIFCIEKDASCSQTSLAFEHEQDFRNYLKVRRGVVRALNNGNFTLFDEDNMLCKIETSMFDDFCPCRVDFWNFVFMLSNEDDADEVFYESCRCKNPAYANLSYEDFREQAWNAMRQQRILRPIMSSTVFQCNIPYLEKDMLSKTFSLSDLL